MGGAGVLVGMGRVGRIDYRCSNLGLGQHGASMSSKKSFARPGRPDRVRYMDARVRALLLGRPLLFSQTEDGTACVG